MSTKDPFFSQFIEAQELDKDEIDQVSGGRKCKPIMQTMKAPSDDDEGIFVTMKHPSDDDEGGYVTLKYPSDDDEGSFR